MEHNQGVTPAGSGYQPTASAAEEASSQSGIPNAMRSVADKLERGSHGALMDGVVAVFLGWSSLKTVRGGVVGMAPGSRRSTQRVPRFTGSLDDALTLVPEGCCVDMRRFDGGSEGFAQVRSTDATPDDADDELYVESEHCATLALAVCAAALKARAAIADTHAKRGDAEQAPSVMSGGGAEGNRT